MQTPKGLTLEGFYQARAVFLSDDCYTAAVSGRVCCKKCGGRIKVVAAKIEIHEAGKAECVGNGELFESAIPYCPHCEALPASVWCVHA